MICTCSASREPGSGRRGSAFWGSSAGRVGRTVSAPVLSDVTADEADAASSSSWLERFRLSSTPSTALPLVRHSGALLQSASQVKALRPTSSASTARRL